MAEPDAPTDPAGLGSRFDAAEESSGLLLWRVTNRWQAAVRAALEPHDLTHVQYVLLASLTWHREHHRGRDDDHDLTQAELAAFAGADVMMTSQVLRKLEQRGLVGRRPSPDDGRARLVRVTPAGARAAREANGDVEAADAAFFAVLGDQHPGFTAHLRALSRTT